MNRSILVLGYAGVGKTSYINAVSNMMSTIFSGDDVYTLTFYEGTKGAGELDTTHTKPHGVVIMFDWTNSQTYGSSDCGLEKWFSYTKSIFGNDVPMLLCGAKVDSYDFRKVEATSLGKSFKDSSSVSAAIGKSYSSKGGCEYMDVSSTAMTNISDSVYSLLSLEKPPGSPARATTSPARATTTPPKYVPQFSRRGRYNRPLSK